MCLGRLHLFVVVLGMVHGRMVRHEVLKNQHGGELINDRGALLDGHFRVTKDTVGLGRGEPLIPEMNGQLELGAELLGEGRHLFRLDSFCTAHAEWQAHNDFANIIIMDDVVEGREVGTFICAANGLETLGGNAEGIGNGHPNGAGAYVER